MKRFRILRSGSREVVAVVETKNADGANNAVIAKEVEMGLPPCALFYEMVTDGEAQRSLWKDGR